MTLGFALFRLLAQIPLPHMRFMFFGPKVCIPLPPDQASRPSPCGSASGSCHQGPQETFTPKSVRPAGRTKEKGPNSLS